MVIDATALSFASSLLTSLTLTSVIFKCVYLPFLRLVVYRLAIILAKFLTKSKCFNHKSSIKNLKNINIDVFFLYNNVKISFSFSGKGPINIFLHGWGQNKDVFKNISQHLPRAKWLLIDLPPFGASGEVENWTLFSYANMVISLCEHLNISKSNIFGHSFGGRIAILIASLKPELVNNLVLISSAGMKPRRSVKYYFSVAKYKVFKILGLIPVNAGSKDYQNLPDKSKSTFVSIVNTFLEDYCFNISAPTLIIFGEKDEVTPIYMARRLNRLIKNSKLEIISYAGHFCYEERPQKVVKIINKFFKENKCN